MCPWNAPKFVQLTRVPDFAARSPGEPPFGVQGEAGALGSHPGTRSPSLIALLEMALDEVAWNSFSRGSALRRVRRAGFARNVCVAMGNHSAADAVPVLSRALCDAEPLVRGHAAWALGRIGSAEAIAALLGRGSEGDAWVRAEIALALEGERKRCPSGGTR